ncbi:MAG: Omp28-related outer membrane protein [Flavobacteriales bacterium]|nr:Omp28-related outer membrane protein [Flavobacteriales bacterium]
MRGIILSAMVSTVVLTSCDIIDDPALDLGFVYNEDLYGPAPSFSPAPSSEHFKRVIIEDFTGHECGNCPTAHHIAEDLDTQYGDSLAVVAAHVTDLAAPNLPDFPAEYRTNEGNAWWAPFDGLGIPIGRVNRSGGISNPWPYTLWGSEVTAQFAQSPLAVLQMQVEYVEENNDLNVHVYTEFLEGLTGTYNLAVVILESHIVSPQLEYLPQPFVWEEYEHNHMLRGSITGPFGLQIVSNPEANSSVLKSYTYGWNSNWIPENCAVLAMLIDNSNGEIVNSVEAEIGE